MTDNYSATYSKVRGLWVDTSNDNGIAEYISPDLPSTCVYLGKLTDEGLALGSLTSAGEAVYAADGTIALTLDGDTGGTVTSSLLAVDSEAVNRAVYGDDAVVLTVNGPVVKMAGKTTPPRRYIFESLKSDGRIERVVITRGSLVQDGDQTMVYNSATSLPITISPAADQATGDYVWKIPVRGSGGSSTSIVVASSVEGGGGTITPEGNTTVEAGTDYTATVTLENTHEIEDWIVDGVPTGFTTTTLTLENVFSPHTIVVVTKLKA